MKINFENRDYESQVIKNTRDIEELKEKYKGEVYAALPYSEWPDDVVLEQVEDPREFTYVPRAITNVPADAKYGYFLLNVEDFVDPSNSAALLFKIKSVNNSTVYIEFYANIASHVPGPQGEQGIQGETGQTGPQGPAGISIYYANTALSTTSGNSTTVAVTTITNYGETLVLNINDLIVGSNGYLGAISAIDLPNLTVKTMTSLVGPQGQATIGIQVVAELPASGTEGVIYLVPTEDPETGNAYDEYIYTNSAWEKFGYVNIDLTNYALKSEIPVIDEDLIPKAFNTYVLGDNTHSYKEVVANKFKSPNSYYEISGVNINGHGQVSIKTTDGNGTNEAQIQLGNTALYTNKNIAPMSGSTVNLGQASNGFNNLYLDGKIVTDDNLTYGLTLPDTTSYTADKTIATTDQIPTLPTYSISNVVTDSSDVLGLQVTDGSINYNIHNTTANPTLAGTESNLTSIDIGGTAYKIPSGTTVVANPTLAGTESNLTGLEIGSTKYALPYATTDEMYEQHDYDSIVYAMNASQNDGNLNILFDYSFGGTTYDMLIGPNGNDTGNYVVPLDMQTVNNYNILGEHLYFIPNKGIYSNPDSNYIITLNNKAYCPATLIQSFKTEQWTFTLSDNTTVTKNILVA